jgi:hypothetical protein
MGEDVEARRKFNEENAMDVKNLGMVHAKLTTTKDTKVHEGNLAEGYLCGFLPRQIEPLLKS